MGKTDGGLVPLVLSTLRQAGWWAERLQSGVVRGSSGKHVRMARAGSPDVVALYPARGVRFLDGDALIPAEPWLIIPAEPWLIECKAPKGSLRPEQAHLAGWCRDHGVRYVVVRTTDDVANLVEGRKAK